MLEIRNLTAGYGAFPAIHDISLKVTMGQIVALIGANGAGKSTLVRALSGTVAATSGTIKLEGKVIDGLTSGERVNAGIVQVPEGRQVFPGLTVAENLFLGAYVHRKRLSHSDLQQRIQETCASFPVLFERMSTPAGNLSGGQQQMLAIARGLMSRPRLLVLDEPSLGLSPSLVTEIFRLIASLRKKGQSILLSEQNARLSLAVADRAYVIENGSIVLEGTGAELLARPDIAARYLGGSAGEHTSESRRAALTAQLVPLLVHEETRPS
jgi:branched-chain amino acid transport system ATP-binding protein